MGGRRPTGASGKPPMAGGGALPVPVRISARERGTVREEGGWGSDGEGGKVERRMLYLGVKFSVIWKLALLDLVSMGCERKNSRSAFHCIFCGLALPRSLNFACSDVCSLTRLCRI